MTHRSIPLVALACMLALAACSAGEQAAQRAVEAASPEQPPAPVTAPATPPTVPPPAATDDPPMPPSSAPDGDRDLARWDGYDALRFGMDDAAFGNAWSAELKKDAPMEGSTCFHAYPTWTTAPAELAFMFEDGRFVRYSVEGGTLLAPGGGKVGMSAADIERLYPGRIEHQPHHYTDGEYLRIKAAQGNGVLVFETDGKTDAARVTGWRVGVPPQVDYVEGCS